MNHRFDARAETPDKTGKTQAEYELVTFKKLTHRFTPRLVSLAPPPTALIFEANDPTETHTSLTFSQLKTLVSRTANVLLSNGIKKGDRAALYLPMTFDLPISMLACARIGAVHSVVFGGFSSV